MWNTGCTCPGPRACGSQARVARGRQRPISRLHAFRAALWIRFQRFEMSCDHAASASPSTRQPRRALCRCGPRCRQCHSCHGSLSARRGHRRQHHRHAWRLQRFEQHPPPVTRPHHAADFARPLLARLTAPAPYTPLPWLARLRRDTVSPVHRRPQLADSAEIHATARAANAGRRLRTALDTNRTPAQQLDPIRPDQHRLTPDRRPRNPLLIAVGPGRSRPLRNHHHLALQAGGRRFEPGTLHHREWLEQAVPRSRRGLGVIRALSIFPCWSDSVRSDAIRRRRRWSLGRRRARGRGRTHARRRRA
jgi:hypothetical protein